MLRNSILASNVIYLSYKHDKKIIDKYLDKVSSIFKQIAKYDAKYIENKLLLGPICQSEFKRFN